MNIGENIKSIRELKGYSQEVMASNLDISQKTYSNIEKAGNDISYERIQKIADILEVSVTKILQLNTEHILNSNNQSGGISQLNTAATYNYLNEAQAKLYERIIEEKDKLLEEKDRVIEILRRIDN
ncbi:MAG: helix-turn-helix transcriptional regulator [Crocinitomicaceae bacterium]|nr:helix-turn-helix transcriptional regulator [Crocinitomicaceae bacterium]